MLRKFKTIFITIFYFLLLSLAHHVQATETSYNQDIYEQNIYNLDNYALQNYQEQTSYEKTILTKFYVLKKGDTLDKIAKQYNLTLEALAKINEDHDFVNGFDKVKAGDIIYVPTVPVSDEMAQYLAGKEENNSNITAMAEKVGSFLENGGHRSDLTTYAKSYFTSKANIALNSFLNQYGTARVTINLDDEFSLKNSQFELLLPLYDQGERLIFTQSAFHRTDDRTQANLGFGFRYFAPDYMIGGNAFFDYDLSRSHSRLGVGMEYWRDYIKLSANAYLRLSDWRISPDVVDYLERPATGWDLRAEAYMPSYPQLGVNLNFEQYYGQEVALFGKDNLQKNPFAVTIGASYTPIPLVTFDVDYRQGTSDNRDMRVGFQMNYRFGVPLKDQLDPRAVEDMRSLKGQRYDLVERNNNIILEYKKQELIFISMIGGITGFYNETYPLGINVTSKYAVDSVNIVATSFLEAGGQLIKGGSNTDYFVTLPHYQFGSDNNYIIEATATDEKGNVSKPAHTVVTLNMPNIDGQNSNLTPVHTTLTGDGQSQVVLTLTLNSSEGRPYDVAAEDVKFTVTGQKTAKISSAFTKIDAGVFQLTVVAGDSNEDIVITPSVNGQTINSATIFISTGLKSARIAAVTHIGDEDTKVADGINYHDFEAEVVDENGNPVPYATVSWSRNQDNTNFITDSNTRANIATSVSDENGKAKARLQSTTTAVYHIIVDAKVNTTNDATPANHMVYFIADGNPDTSEGNSSFFTKKMVITADGVDTTKLTFIAKDSNGNFIMNLADRLAFQATNTNTKRIATQRSGENVTISPIVQEAPGIYTAQMSGTLVDLYDVKPLINAKPIEDLKLNVILSSGIADIFDPETGGKPLSSFTASKPIITANGTDSSVLTLVGKDENGNNVTAIAGMLEFVVTIKGTDEIATGVSVGAITETVAGSGIYKAVLTGTLAGDYTITPLFNHINISGKLIGTLSADVSLVSDSATAKIVNLHLLDDVTNKIANGETYFTYQLYIKDANDNPIQNAVVNWSHDKGLDALFNSIITQTDETGKTSVLLKSTTKAVADIVVSATINQKTADADKMVSFIADKATMKIEVNLVGDTTAKPADGKSYFEYTAFVADKFNNPIAGLTINWTKTPAESATLSATNSATDTNGIAKIKLTSTQTPTENIIVTGTIAGDTNQTASASAVAFHINWELQMAWLDARDNVSVDNQPIFSVKVIDKSNGNTPVPNVKVSFTLNTTSTTASIYPLDVTSDANGIIAINPTVANHTPSTLTVIGTINEKAISNKLPIAFIAGKLDKITSTIYAENALMPADGLSQTKIIFQPKDQYGNLITSIDANSIASDIIGIDDNKIKISSWIFDVSKQAYVSSLTAGNTAGNIKVIPIVNGEDAIDRNSKNIITFIAGDIDIDQSSIVARPNEVVADGKSKVLIFFYPRDKKGNLITHIEPANISQIIMHNGSSVPSKATMGAWVYYENAQAYVSELTASEDTGYIDIMPIISGQNAASIGVEKTVNITPLDPEHVIKFELVDVVSEDLQAIADGVATNQVKIKVTDQEGVVANQVIKITPGTSELKINGLDGALEATTDANGIVTLKMSSTKAKWRGTNYFNVFHDGYNANLPIDFKLYVDPEKSVIMLDKNILYNNGEDVLSATFTPFDKAGFSIDEQFLGVSFATTDDKAVLVSKPQSNLSISISSNNTPATHHLSAKMSKYTLWQPNFVAYHLQPLNGVLLARLEITPKLCARVENHLTSGVEFTSCSPNDNISYYHSGIGFIISLKEANSLWDKKITLNSTEVDGAIILKTSDGRRQQNCSASVIEDLSWMNDFGHYQTHDLALTFKNIGETIDTYKTPGYSLPSHRSVGGVGSCDIQSGNFIKLNPQLTGTGNLHFSAKTDNPPATTNFMIPLTNQRIDAGELSSFSVDIYTKE